MARTWLYQFVVSLPCACSFSPSTVVGGSVKCLDSYSDYFTNAQFPIYGMLHMLCSITVKTSRATMNSPPLDAARSQ